MTRRACLALLCLAACNDEPPRLLAEASNVRLVFGASPVFAWVAIENDGPGGCLVLHESFRATLNGAGMVVEHQGSGDPSSSCRGPSMRIVNPPTAESSTLELADDSMRIRVGLADLVAPRSLRPIPDPGEPWILETGKTVTAYYTGPLADLRVPGAHLRLGGIHTPFVASGDALSFEVPDLPGSLTMELHADPHMKSWPCTNVPDVTCTMQRPPLIVQPVQIRRPATM